MFEFWRKPYNPQAGWVIIVHMGSDNRFRWLVKDVEGAIRACVWRRFGLIPARGRHAVHDRPRTIWIRGAEVARQPTR